MPPGEIDSSVAWIMLASTVPFDHEPLGILYRALHADAAADDEHAAFGRWAVLPERASLPYRSVAYHLDCIPGGARWQRRRGGRR